MELNYPLKVSKKTIDIKQRKKKQIVIDSIVHFPPEVHDLESLCRFIYDKYGGGRYILEDSSENLLFEGLVFSDSFNVLGGTFRKFKQPTGHIKMPILVSELRKIDKRLKEDIVQEREILKESMEVLKELKGELRGDLGIIKTDIGELESATRDNRKLVHEMKFETDLEMKKYSILINKQSEAIQELLKQNMALLETISGKKRRKKPIKKKPVKKAKPKPKAKPKAKPKKAVKKSKPKTKPKKPSAKKTKPKKPAPKKKTTKAKPKKPAKPKPKRPSKPKTSTIKAAPKAKKKRKKKQLKTPKPTVAAYFSKSPVKITGQADAGTTVEVFVNRASAGRALTTKNGNFSLGGVKLKKGANTVIIHAFDDKGNRSPKSKPMKVVLGPKPAPKPKSKAKAKKPSKPVAKIKA